MYSRPSHDADTAESSAFQAFGLERYVLLISSTFHFVLRELSFAGLNPVVVPGLATGGSGAPRG